MEPGPTEIVREYFKRQYLEPALRAHKESFEVLVGDVHRALRFHNRVPIVCQALSNATFLRNNNLIIEKTEGPPRGLGTRVKFFYRLAAPVESGESSFLRLRGAGKDLFASLGGGERFIEEERAGFYGSQADKR